MGLVLFINFYYLKYIKKWGTIGESITLNKR